MLRKGFFRLYYRRHRRFTTIIDSLVCTNGDATITKVGAHFNTEGHDDQLFVGDTNIINSSTYRVASITSDTEYELKTVFNSGTSTYTGTFTTPALNFDRFSTLINERDYFWTEFFKVETGASLKVGKGDNVVDSMGNVYDVDEVAELLLNIMGTEDYESLPDKEGRWDELRLALQNQPTDILISNDDYNNPQTYIYYDIQGNVQISAIANDIRRIHIDVGENKSIIDEDTLDIPIFRIETPVWTLDIGEVPLSVILSCTNKQAKIWYGKYSDESAFLVAVGNGTADWFIGDLPAFNVTEAGNYYARADKDQMTNSDIGTAVYT